MAKGASDVVLDAALNTIAACTRVDIVSDTVAPTGLTNSLAYVSVDSGDFSIADGTTGRTLTLAAQSGIATTASGTPGHLVLSIGGVIRAYVSCTGDDLVYPGTTNIPPATFNFGDPT